jgi:hypothetical protein
VGISGPISIEDLTHRVSELRGRPIVLATFGGHSGCGAWIATDRADYIVTSQGASPYQRITGIAHELGHMVNGDQPKPATPEQALAVFSHLNPDLVKSALGLRMRSVHYTDPDERRAERFGRIVASYIADHARNPQHADGLVEQLNRSLGVR